MALRATGMTDEQIAEETGRTPKSVKTTIRKQLEKWAGDDRASANMVRALLMFELDQMKRVIYTKALNGDLKSVREVTRIIQIQADLSGARAPVKHEHSGAIGVVPGLDKDEVARMEEAWLHGDGDVVDATVVEIGSGDAGG